MVHVVVLGMLGAATTGLICRGGHRLYRTTIRRRQAARVRAALRGGEVSTA